MSQQRRKKALKYLSDMKAALQNRGQPFSYYPDIMAAYDLDENGGYQCTKPLLIVEVLSTNTERVDLWEKFDNYVSIPTLLE